MTVFKQNLLATSLLVTALSLSLLISYWLNQNNSNHNNSAMVNTDMKIQKLTKLNHSLILLLPAIK